MGFAYASSLLLYYLLFYSRSERTARTALPPYLFYLSPISLLGKCAVWTPVQSHFGPDSGIQLLFKLKFPDRE
ncbi:hypothetical protein EU77_14575 [Mesotoga sp. SC_NapDC]|nr:hypothetical protein EU77_14575 [Mesotoga sp. SC_NapDC]